MTAEELKSILAFTDAKSMTKRLEPPKDGK